MKLLMLVLFLSYLIVNCVNGEEDKLLRIPLRRMESGLEKLLRRGADIKLIEGIYNMLLHKADGRTKIKDGKPIPTNDTLPLFKYFGTQYYGLVNVGKPGKQFKMVMDTAWGYSFVLSKDCSKLTLPCARHVLYDHSQSSTYVADNRSFSMGDKFFGYLSQDTFLVGQMNCSNQTFAELTSLPWIFGLYESDGSMGLGLEGLSPTVTPFFYNFYRKNKLKPIFSFYINRDPTTKRGGSIFFGGIDPKHNKTDFTKIPVISDKYWQFQMDKITLIISKKKTQDFCQNGCQALADTSSNTIVGPPNEIKEINRLIGAQEIWFSDRYMIPCELEYKGPKLNFTISGKTFQIFPRDYIQKLSYSGITVCLSAFQPASGPYQSGLWELGGAFLYQFYMAFDVVNRQILIAEAA